MPILGTLASSVQKITGSFEPIATATGTGSSGTITFSSIPNTYKSLQIRCLAFGSVLNQNTMIIRFNSDSGSNYARHVMYNIGTDVYAFGGANTTFIGLGNYSKQLNSTYPTAAIVDIHDYASTSKNKTVRSIGGLDENSSGEVTLQSGVWRNTSSIDSISILTPGQNFTTNTVFSLYGIKGA